MKKQSQKKNKKLIAGAILGTAAGLAAASVPVIIPLVMNGAVAKPTEGNTINFIGEEVIDIPGEDAQLFLSKKQDVDAEQEYEIIVDTSSFSDFGNRAWGIAVGQINEEQEVQDSIVDKIDITLDGQPLYENKDYTIDEHVVTGKVLNRNGLLRAKIKVTESKEDVYFAVSSFDDTPEQEWVWSKNEAVLFDFHIEADTEYTFSFKNFQGMEMEQASKLKFNTPIDTDSGNFAAFVADSVQIWHNNETVPFSKIPTPGCFYFDSTLTDANIICEQTFCKNDTCKIVTKFDVDWSSNVVIQITML